MKEFLIKVVCTLFVFLILIYGLDFIIQEGIRGLSYSDIRKWDEVIEGDIDAEIIILGSSRALVHFDPRIIEIKSGKSCYNLGVDGNKYEVQKKILELYLAHNDSPKILYWSIDLGMFKPVDGVYEYEQFIPYWSDKIVQEILALNRGLNMSYLNYPIVRYANNKNLIYKGLAAYVPLHLKEPVLVKGYRERDVNWDGRFDEFAKENRNGIAELVNDSLFHDFQLLSASLKKKDIDVRWVITPYYQGALDLTLNSDDIIQKYKVGAEVIGVKFQNYASTPISKNIQNFYNGSHLNKNGVAQFMEMLEFDPVYKLELGK